MFCLQNHPKYAPIYLNLPSGNDFRGPKSPIWLGFEGLRPSVATIWYQWFMVEKTGCPSDGWNQRGTLFSLFLRVCPSSPLGICPGGAGNGHYYRPCNGLHANRRLWGYDDPGAGGGWQGDKKYQIIYYFLTFFFNRKSLWQKSQALYLK